MSIYGSLSAPCDDHLDECGGWHEIEDHGQSYEWVGPCDCGLVDAPLVYQGSHILPSETDERGGWIDIASIPSFITRDGRDDGPSDDSPWPFLRFGVNESTVVLTRRNVEQVAASLNEWLASLSPLKEKESSGG